MRKTVEGELLREVIVKIGLERIDMQKRIIVEILLDSGATGLVMSSEFVRKQEFKLKKIETLIYVRNTDRTFNKKRLIEHTMEVNIYYQGHRERTEINVIRDLKWNMILEMLWLVHYNSEIDWKTGEVKITRYPDKCRKQWRPKQGKLEWQKQKEKEEEEEQKKKKQKKGKTMKIKKMAEK